MRAALLRRGRAAKRGTLPPTLLSLGTRGEGRDCTESERERKGGTEAGFEGRCARAASLAAAEYAVELVSDLFYDRRSTPRAARRALTHPSLGLGCRGALRAEATAGGPCAGKCGTTPARTRGRASAQ